MTHIAEIVTPVYTCWTTLINIPHTCIFIHKIPLSSPPFSEDTDDETGQVLRGMDSLPPVLRRYVHADNCWFQQEISEWEEQFCQSQQVQQGQASQAGEPATAAASGPQEEETSPGSGPEAVDRHGHQPALRAAVAGVVAVPRQGVRPQHVVARPVRRPPDAGRVEAVLVAQLGADVRRLRVIHSLTRSPNAPKQKRA